MKLLQLAMTFIIKAANVPKDFKADVFVAANPPWVLHSPSKFALPPGGAGGYYVKNSITQEEDAAGLIQVFVAKLDRVELKEKHGNIDHGTEKHYTATVYDVLGNDVTDNCSIEWKISLPSAIGGTFKSMSATGSSYGTTWNIQDGDNSQNQNIQTLPAAVHVVATAWGEAVNDSCLFNVNKGTLVDQFEFYKKNSDEKGDPKTSDEGTPVVIDRTDVFPAPSVNYTVSSSLTISGSVSVSGNAKATIRIPIKSLAPEVSVGVTGQLSVSHTDSWSLTGTVVASNSSDILVQMYRKKADRKTHWTLWQKKIYNTGFVEEWDDGDVKSIMDESTIHVKFIYRDE